jgi:hypothetical protein
MNIIIAMSRTDWVDPCISHLPGFVFKSHRLPVLMSPGNLPQFIRYEVFILWSSDFGTNWVACYSGNALDLYSWGAQFKSQPWHRQSWPFCDFSELLQANARIDSTSVGLQLCLSNSLFISHLTIWHYNVNTDMSQNNLAKDRDHVVW